MKYLASLLLIFLLGGILCTAGCVGEEKSVPVAAGENITVQFTGYIGDKVMVTSSTEKYNELLKAGQMPTPLLLVENPVITAAATTDDDYMTIPAKVGSSPFWLLPGEYNVMAANLVGMQKGETKLFPIYASGTNTTSFWSNADCVNLSITPSALKPGDMITYTRTIGETGVDENGEFNTTAIETTQKMVRDMLVVSISADGVTYQEIYDTIEMTVL